MNRFPTHATMGIVITVLYSDCNLCGICFASLPGARK